MRNKLLMGLVLVTSACTPGPGFPQPTPNQSARPLWAQGTIVQDENPTHLALNGDAFFVLSTEDDPRGLEHIRFSREGAFHFEFEPGPVPGTGNYRLINDDGMRVMGWRTIVDPQTRPFGTAPAGGRGTDLRAFAVVIPAGAAAVAASFGSLVVSHEANPNVGNGFSFDAQGMLRVRGVEPRDSVGRELNMHVALARPVKPAELHHEGGGYLAYTTAAGPFDTGTAGTSNNPVGAHVVISSGARERLPLLTPSRFDRKAYPDALDPQTVLPPGEALIRKALVTGARLDPADPTQGTYIANLASLDNGVVTDRRWTVRVGPGINPVQQRDDILRPIPRAALTRGAIVDVWADPTGSDSLTARGVVIDRGARGPEVQDVYQMGWY